MIKKLFSPKICGFIVPNIIALLIIGGTSLLSGYGHGSFIFSEFVIIPFFIGIISAWFWRGINLGPKN
jgi:hypothetical protein